MLNKSIIMGRFVADPELKMTTLGTPVVTFTVAVDRNTKDKITDFIDCVAWKATAEFITKHFRKGNMIALEGAINTRTWEDKDGRKRKAVEITVAQVYFCGEKVDRVPEGFNDMPVDDGDLPF